ncbi:MAG: DUF2975 domain-containing protein [Methylocystis sp.]
MIDADTFAAPAAPPALRDKIAWICQTARFAALGYAVWTLYINVTYWSHVTRINDGYGHFLQRDLSGVRPWQQAAAFGVHFVVWALAALACYGAWRLFTGYLQGQIFTPRSALWLRRLALCGIAAQLLGIVVRPLLSVILTMHFPAGEKLRIVNIFAIPDDLSTLLLLFGLLALAHIQKTAAEIADDHARIV